MLIQKQTYEQTCAAFSWQIPDRYNIGIDVCDRWAETEPERIAIIDVSEDGTAQNVSYAQLKSQSNKLANALKSRGILGKGDKQARGEADPIGDRIGVLLPQSIETAVAHIAALKMGCVSIPLFTLFGVEALLHRLRDSGAKAVITNKDGAQKLAQIRGDLPDLDIILTAGGPEGGAGDGTEDLAPVMESEGEDFTPFDSHSDDPAILIYTSGTTGNPKGALHGHRVLLGHLPGVEISHNFLPQPGDKIWTPADWAWIGGLLDVLMPALHHGVPVVARRFAKFSGEAALDLIKAQNIQNAFLPPTALKLMRQVEGAESWGIKMRSVGSGGESLGTELLEWGQRVLGTTINEFYGQTECNMIVSSCSVLDVTKNGAMGRAVPGHDVQVVDAKSGKVMQDKEEGAIAVRSPNPVMFLRYWNNEEATNDKFVDGPDGRWLLTGDQGIRDEEGFLRFVGRDDDVIGSAGYRIGPGEVEDCLIRHPAVQFAGVVGKPDALRNAVVAAYIKLADGYEASDELAKEIALFVKSRLAAHEYPRVVRFIDDMPMTTTGKIIRGSLRTMAQEEAKREKGS
ncbi:MAG: AMP-binding protein [Cohaesibacter sp.]|jgi:acetyl-CoA synthetase|nr:AMP-binding protein [Cohaesibacter sp.]